MNLKEEYENYFSGLDSRFNPKFLSISEETTGLIKLIVQETFQNHCIESTFLYRFLNCNQIMPVCECVDYDSDDSDSVFSLNSFDTSDHREEKEPIIIISKKDLDSRKWTYMVPLEDWSFANRNIALPIIEST
jgi:hypothetical protein